ncbi:CBL-interacting serine/threonine-protein kinase 21 isoform X2 [Phoenix dactylifera]|uniref:non-specific serine/threonine protein kinase n=1 Tax=Phoenix dactylifera TaxID=42345 RepID=A0A8B8J4N4_PHODC|nr:CBL-interacting serine/threonine-protein kinase 21 isoform X2 [Phoenix dactylifera]
MGFATSIGKYHLGRTIGEGNFAKVKLAVNTETNKNVAVKIIDKKMVLQNKLMYQVKREISTMKLLHHPNIVKIYEVIATKTRIYLVMEYVPGGQLSDKLYYLKRLDEREARKFFQQLIDAMDYCHGRGVYHRDLKPENLLLDGKGNLKVSDFGLCVLRKPGDLLSTACGSPSYVAPEVIVHKHYEGAAADVWSCGVILFELLAGYLPFEDRSLMNLYRKISRAEYTCPYWFTASQRKLISKMLDPLPTKRATIAKILEDEWFRVDYEPSAGYENDEDLNSDDISNTMDSENERTNRTVEGKLHRFINAFQLIAMSSDLDLSGLFHEQKTKLGSEHSIDETLEKIEVAAKDVSLYAERMRNSKVKLHRNKSLTRSRSPSTLSAEVFEVTPIHCVVEISKSAGDLTAYKETFINSFAKAYRACSGRALLVVHQNCRHLRLMKRLERS